MSLAKLQFFPGADVLTGLAQECEAKIKTFGPQVAGRLVAERCSCIVCMAPCPVAHSSSVFLIACACHRRCQTHSGGSASWVSVARMAAEATAAAAAAATQRAAMTWR